MPQGPGTSYSNCHWRVFRRFGKASLYGCWFCDDQAKEWAWIHDADPNDTDSYIPLCKPCHIAYDGGGYWTGRRMTEDQRRVLSLSHIGTPQSEDTIAKRSAALKSKPWSAARRAAEDRRSKIV